VKAELLQLPVAQELHKKGHKIYGKTFLGSEKMKSIFSRPCRTVIFIFILKYLEIVVGLKPCLSFIFGISVEHC